MPAMPAQMIDGRALSERARAEVARRASECAARGLRPRLDALLVSAGDNAARVYAENQARTCEAVGIEYVLHEVPGSCGQQELEARVRSLNADPAVHAAMLHLPLPEGVDAYSVQKLLDPEKDAENVTPTNIGDVVYGRSQRAPCTALAAVRLVESTGVELRGARCVVVGAGPVVGRPIAALLMQREATVISANKHTWGLEDLCRSADVLIPAAGVPGLITAGMVRPGAVVVDVGINRVAGEDGRVRTVGDCVAEEVARLAGHLSPVPGGVGPMTVAVLLTNVVDAAERRIGAAT
jgi:methylenetetrahydrofolate dehydrogenase (NADP+)/methenyltetrahydrofolate cyclohydrolase